MHDVNVRIRHTRFQCADTIILRAVTVSIQHIRTLGNALAAALVLCRRETAQLPHTTEHRDALAGDFELR